MNFCYQNTATLHVQVWYIQSFSDRFNLSKLRETDGSKHNIYVQLVQCRAVVFKDKHLHQYTSKWQEWVHIWEPHQLQKFQHIITNAWGIPLRALPAEYWKAVFAWWHSISKHKQAKKIFCDFLYKATPANDMQLFTKKQFQLVSVRLEITCTRTLK